MFEITLENEDIMAAAEARAAWQRAANRCFVQEDAKRAPKLACCPSSSSAQLNELNIAEATNVQNKCLPSSMPSNFNFKSSKLRSDTKWWLQTQPNFGSRKDFLYEQLKVFPNQHAEAEETIDHASSFTDEANGASIESNNMEVFPETSCIASETLTGHDSEGQIQQMKEVKHKVESELLDTKPIDYSLSSKANLESETPWGRSNKCEPWWRVSDKEELASFVAQKSLENIENCDLPRPAHICRSPFACPESWDGNRILSSFACNVDAGMYRPVDYPEYISGFREMDGKYWHSDHACDPTFATEKPSRDARSSKIPAVELAKSEPISAADQSRTQLLAALRLSQSRARNAEMAAQKACDEKEHIVKLLLRQASHLFAHKQWLQILQLESLFLRPGPEGRPIGLPWSPLRAKGRDGSRRKGEKRQKRCRWCRYAFLLAVGLGLAGAGLFLGCCLGLC